MIRGQTNQVQIRVASVADFLIMKAYALANRDKPKDAYDICYCLDHYPGGLKELALNWKPRPGEKDVVKAMEILRQKFAEVDAYGPGQAVEFHNAESREEHDRQARRAFELVQEFLKQASPMSVELEP
jgi:predicted nucleotidyltransferase component of viral defense system